MTGGGGMSHSSINPVCGNPVPASTVAASTHSRLPVLLLWVQHVSFVLLLLFTPLARGAARPWGFCIAVWLALVSFAAMTARRMLQHESFIPKTALNVPIAVLIVLAASSWFGSIYRDATAWALLRHLLYVAAFYLTVEITESRRQTRRFVWGVVGMGLLVSFIALIAHSGAPFPSYWKSDPSSMNSPFVNHNHLGGYLAMTFVLGLGFVCHRTNERVLVWSGALLLMLIVLCLSMSRGAWISVFAAVELMLGLFLLKKEISRFKLRLVVFSLFTVVAITILGSNSMIARLQTLTSPDVNLYERAVVWSGCLEMIRANPLTGTGLGTFPWAFTDFRPPGLRARWWEAHNDYLQIVTDVGIPALVPIVWGLIILYRTGLHSYRTTFSRLHAGAVLGSLGGITAILVHSISDFNIQITSNGILFACLTGLVMGRYSWTKH